MLTFRILFEWKITKYATCVVILLSTSQTYDDGQRRNLREAEALHGRNRGSWEKMHAADHDASVMQGEISWAAVGSLRRGSFSGDASIAAQPDLQQMVATAPLPLWVCFATPFILGTESLTFARATRHELARFRSLGISCSTSSRIH